MTDEQKRKVYKDAFGKEYNDAKRKLHPLPLDMAYDIAIAKIKERLEYLRGEIEAERIAYGEIAELQSLANYIEKDDVLLLEWAGVSEFPVEEIVFGSVTNSKWYKYEDVGYYYRLVAGTLQATAILDDGSMIEDDRFDVDFDLLEGDIWEGKLLSDRLKEIGEELTKKD